MQRASSLVDEETANFDSKRIDDLETTFEPAERRSQAAMPRLTQPEMVLMAMFRASQGRAERIPYEEIVIQAWRSFPDSFSLRNHPEFPDASDVHKKLYQALKPRGLVVAVGDKQFRLTDKGIERGAELEALLRGRPAPVRGRLHRDEETFIAQARQTDAYKAWASGDSSKLIDYDVQILLRFGSGASVADRQRRLSNARETAARAAANEVLGAEQLKELIEHLASRFSYLFEEGRRP